LAQKREGERELNPIKTTPLISKKRRSLGRPSTKMGRRERIRGFYLLSFFLRYFPGREETRKKKDPPVRLLFGHRKGGGEKQT